MLFNSLEYLLFFLPAVWLVFRLLARLQLSNAQFVWLVACSLFFYASWNAVFVLLMAASVLSNYLFGRALLACIQSGRARLLLFLGVTFNLGLLGYFKYTGFFVENLNAIAGTLLPMPSITLPLAISFFTFQQIAYLVDVYRKEAQEYSFLHYCLFVTFFPQLVAGPIVHHKEMMPQFNQAANAEGAATNLQVGITIIFLGLFKKVILADNLALLSDPLFAKAENGGTLSFTEAWIAVTAFTGQIYFDFSGYTDIAIGSARLFGIKLPENFFSPYKSRNIIEFWRRWHITLSRFLRDYLYISLGGNRKGKVKRYRNLLVTMLLGGLWHGAHWNFVIWGGLHALYLITNHFWISILPRKKRRPIICEFILAGISRTTTLLAVMVAWVFFRSETTQGALIFLEAMIKIEAFYLDPDYIEKLYSLQPGFSLLHALVPNTNMHAIPLLFLASTVAIWAIAPNTQQILRAYEPVLTTKHRSNLEHRITWRPSATWGILIAAVGYIAILGIGSTAEFIYFQF